MAQTSTDPIHNTTHKQDTPKHTQIQRHTDLTHTHTRKNKKTRTKTGTENRTGTETGTETWDQDKGRDWDMGPGLWADMAVSIVYMHKPKKINSNPSKHVKNHMSGFRASDGRVREMSG